MRLIEMMKGFDHVMQETDINGDLEITGLTCDSRAVRPGNLFAALPGVHVDGRDFIKSAVEQGAACILGPVGTTADVPVIEEGNPRRAFSLMAANFYGRQPEHVAAITGTNGKTSTATFLRQIWEQLGHKAVSLGTIGVHGAGFDEPGTLTTPDPVKLHETLQRIADAGVEHLAMEASSHGLEQYRLDGVRVKAAAFTNITRDHLDYHGTMQEYLNAKMRLFSEVVEDGGWAIINADVPEAQDVAARATKHGLKVATFGNAGGAIQLVERQPISGGQRLALMIGGQNFEVDLPLAGSFQAENALCALGLALALGAPVGEAVKTLGHLQGVPGRLEHIADVNGAQVFLDYAHTPHALQNVLKALRPHARGKLHIVFGCGGDRDAGKRPQMGQVAAELADRVIVTDDNPRSEDPSTIRAQVMGGVPDAIEIGDRRAAIFEGVKGLGDGDVMVVSGKGHDYGQKVGDEVLPFDDETEIRAAIREARA